MDGHGTTNVMIDHLDRTGIQDVTITIIVHTIRDVAMIGEITVVIMIVTTVTQAIVAALSLGIE